VENNSYLTQHFVEFVKSEESACTPPVKLQVTVARHIADAIKNMESQEFDVILLDIMLPFNEEKLKQLEKMETERKALMLQLLKYSNEEKVDDLTRDIVKIRRRIDEIDDIIDNDIQDIEGGYNILKKYLDKQNMASYDRPVIFISARGQVELKDKCKKIIKSNCAWLEKPVSEIDILEKLLSFFDIRHNEDQ
jgi:CheY-like chemotaxis protein